METHVEHGPERQRDEREQHEMTGGGDGPGFAHEELQIDHWPFAISNCQNSKIQQLLICNGQWPICNFSRHFALRRNNMENANNMKNITIDSAAPYPYWYRLNTAR